MSDHRIEVLRNGLIRIFDYGTKSACLYNPDGSYRSGDRAYDGSTDMLVRQYLNK